MTIIDFLYLSLAIGFMILVTATSLLIYNLIRTLALLRRVLSQVEDTTHDVQTLKNTVKFGGLAIISKFLGIVSRRL